MNYPDWIKDAWSGRGRRRPVKQERRFQADDYMRGFKDGINSSADIAQTLGVDPLIVGAIRAGAR